MAKYNIFVIASMCPVKSTVCWFLLSSQEFFRKIGSEKGLIQTKLLFKTKNTSAKQESIQNLATVC